MNIIMLDLDDCLLPSNHTWCGDTADSLQMFEINLKRVAMICERYKLSPFLLSSWYARVSLDDKTLYLKSGASDRDEQIVNLLNKYLTFDAISSGDKSGEIRQAIIDHDKVIVLEDTDFSGLNASNCLVLQVHGFVSNLDMYHIKKFMEKTK